MVNEERAKKLWEDVHGNKEWAKDCFGTWMHRDAWSNESVIKRMPGDSKRYDFSWNVDHIRPKSDFDNELDSNFFNNYEPMQRLNNNQKADNYPHFEVGGVRFKVFKQEEYYGYGIKNELSGTKVDWKSVQGRYYE